MPTIGFDLAARAEVYRGHASTLRLLARQTRSPGAQTRLRTVADSFDCLADHVEARERRNRDRARTEQPI
jgi:hypothetical protein